MSNGMFARRDLLKASIALAAAALRPAPLKAAGESVRVDPDLIAAAHKEGAVAFYTAMDIPVAENLAKMFQATYPGVAVHVKRSGAERVFQRIGEEEAVHLHEVDVVCSTDAAHFVGWKRDGLLAPYLPDQAAKHLPPEQRDPDGMYASVFAVLSPLGFNTNLIKPEDAPKSFTDLLDPKWKGRIVKADPNYSGIILTATFELMRHVGWSYFEGLAQQNPMKVNSALDPPKRLASGASALQADGAEGSLLLLKDQKAPIEVVYPSEGTPLVAAQSAVFLSAPHPNAARLFQSFLFSVEAQQLLVERYDLRSFHALVREKPGRKPLSEIKAMIADPVSLWAQREHIISRYNSIFRP
jgi:iron(III) transport system substrate-binding protein